MNPLASADSIHIHEFGQYAAYLELEIEFSHVCRITNIYAFRFHGDVRSQELIARCDEV